MTRVQDLWGAKSWCRRAAFCAFLLLLHLQLVDLSFAATGARLPHLTSFDVVVSGIAATVEPLEPVVPKNVAAGVRIVVKGGDRVLTAEEVAAQVGNGFEVRGELSGPGLERTITVPEAGSGEAPADPLLLTLPALPIAGDYTLSNIRLVRGGKAVMDVSPASVPVRVIDQVLVTSVTTRPLTLDEIREKGIVLDSDDYLGFEFTIGLATDSQTVSFAMPVVFDRQGVPVPQVIEPPAAPPRIGVAGPELEPPMPLIVPSLLELDPAEIADIPEASLRLPSGAPIHIPSVLVIPGNVGYLKQFFSAQLFVANGTPLGSGLNVTDVTGTVRLPKGADGELGTADDPLALPETVRGQQPMTMSVLGVGPDAEPLTSDDVAALKPGQQGQAEFLIRGEKEGFHALAFDVDATLEGLAVGPITVHGKAVGGVLVRNPFFDMTFTVPSVVRKGETFSVFGTVANIGQGVANDVTVSLDASRMSGLELVGPQTAHIDTLRSGDARTIEFKFLSQRTGKVVATYLNFDAGASGSDNLKFTLGVGERGIALSPDTLVLPAAADALPPSVLSAAMRVLGQAWSISNAPTGTLPSGVQRVSRSVATEKALALAEAGLRVELGQSSAAAIRDLAFDFYGGKSLDPGFDQLLRETQAGRDFARALGAELEPAVQASGGPQAYGADVDQVAASGPDYLRVSIGSGNAAAPLLVSLTDAGGRRSEAMNAPEQLPLSKIPGGAWLPIGGSGSAAPWLGVFTSVTSPLYTLELVGTASGSTDLSVTIPRGGGRFSRGAVTGLSVASGSRQRLVLDLRRPDELVIETDLEGDGSFETSRALSTTVVEPSGAHLLSATVVGPETLDGASPFGLHAALLFDRVVDAESAADTRNYSIPQNSVLAARSQLSGRFVFASLAQPEGPYVPTTLLASGVRDQRGARAPPVSVTLGSKLEDPGAVVSGRVIGPDGAALTSGTITYRNNSNWQCLGSIFEADPNVARSGFSAMQLDASGRYEFRYVRQDQCGFPWAMLTNDPKSGALRSVTGFVRAAGERIVLDIAMLGQGSVGGTVRDLTNQPVPGAAVTVVSQTDPQVGGTAISDGDGHYEVFGITVGAVSVNAAKGAGVGVASGSIARAGGSAIVDVTLDSGGGALSGKVVVVEGSETRPAAGVSVVFEAQGVPVAVAQTNPLGQYELVSLPVGPFKLKAALNTRDRAEASGVLVAGTPGKVDLVVQLPDPNGGSSGGGGFGYGKIRGQVVSASGEPAPNAIVSINGRGGATDGGGAFELTGVGVQPGQAQTLLAQSRDGLRSGSAVAFLNQSGQVVEGIVIVLSGLGSAEFTVLGAGGQPLVGQQVGLLNNCSAACGCEPKVSDASGKVRFDGLPLGAARVRAVRPGATFVDVADAAASITKDGEIAAGTLRFRGAGVVTGVVKNAQGQAVFGADVTLQAALFNDETCSLGGGIAQRVRTNTMGQFRFENVNLGGVSVTASQVFFPNPTSKHGVLIEHGQTLALDLTLSEGASTTAGELRGTVFLPDGLTPAGAGIELTASGALPDVAVSTNSAGQFRFAKIFPEGGYTLTVRDPITGGVAQHGIYLRAGQDLQHDVRLLGRGSVAVRVVDANDAPVARAFVRLQETTFPGRLQEGAIDPANQGVLRFDNVFEGPLSVEVSDPAGRGGRAAAVLATPGSLLEVKVTLSITGRVSGVFVQPDGVTPIAFGSVTLSAGGRIFGQTTTQGSGNDVGRFSFDNVPAGPFRVDAQDPATARTGFASGVISQQDAVVDVELRAQGLGSVEGLVLSNDLPQPGAEVQLVAGSLHASTMSDAHGRYHVSGVPEGLVSVTASLGDGYLSGAATSNLTGDGSTLTLDVRLRDSGSVGGVVLRANGVTPAPASVVTLSIGGQAFTALSDAQGHFGFARLPAGFATISVDVLGSIDEGSGSVSVPAGGSAQTTIKLHGVGSLSGTARNSNGTATAGTVSINGTGSIPYSRTLQVGPDGTFALPEVLAGPFTASLSVQTPTFVLYGSASGSITASTNTVVNLQVQPSGTVRGRALRGGGVAALGTEVSLRLLPSRGSIVTYAGNDGRFETQGVPLGAFELSLLDRVSGGVAAVAGIEVLENGQIIDIGDVQLDTTPVEVVAFDPPNGALDVAVTQPLRVTFSDALQSAAGLLVQRGSQTLASSAALSADRLTITLTGTWSDASEITVTATTGVTDIFGRHPTQDRSAKLHTVDLSGPRVVSVSPSHGAIEIAADTSIEVVFDEPLGPSTDLSTLVAIATTQGSLPGAAQQTSPGRVRFTPSAPLPENSQILVSVSGGRDALNNQQVGTFTSSFTTHDTVAPQLALVQPAPGQWSSNPRPSILISLFDALSGVATDTTTLSIDGAAVTPSRSASSLGFTPPSALAEGAHSLFASAADRGGNLAQLSADLRIDTLPPSTASLVGMDSGAVLSGNVALAAGASDSGSGVERILLLVDGAPVVTLPGPGFAAHLNTTGLAEGRHALAAYAFDHAGNSGPTGASVDVIVDNAPLTVALNSPTQGARLRSTLNAAAVVSEPVGQVVFSLGATTVTDTTVPYTASFDLGSLPEGSAVLNVTATGLLGESATTTREIFVDRTAPPAPDVSRIFAEPPDAGRSFVHGEPSSVEPFAIVSASNPLRSSAANATASASGAFGLQLLAATGDSITLVATDAAGNASEPASVVVRETTTLPPEVASLRFDGVAIDRVGPAALSPDGVRDALFSVQFSMPTNVTRQLAFIDLEGPRTLSTRPELGAPLAVSGSSLGGPLLNDASGQISAEITGNGSLLLYAPAAGFLQAATSYRVTVAFTNGSRFIGSTALSALPTEEVTSGLLSVFNQAVPGGPIGGGEAGSPDPLQPTEVVSQALSLFNQKLPYAAVLQPPGGGQPSDVSSPLLSIFNQKLPNELMLSALGGMQPTETASALLSIRNRQLPYQALLMQPGGGQPTEVAGPLLSLFNQMLPYAAQRSAPGGMQPSEAFSSLLSIDTDPNAAAPTALGPPVMPGSTLVASSAKANGSPTVSDGSRLTLFVSDVTAVESAGSAQLELRLSQPSWSTTTVDYRLERIDLTPESEYEATSQSVSFEAGEQVRTIDIPLYDDGLHEQDEAVFVVFSNPNGLELSRDEAVITINDDDARPDTRAALFDDFEGGLADRLRWSTLEATAVVGEGVLSLDGGELSTIESFGDDRVGATARARLHFDHEAQRFGLQSEAPGGAAYYFETIASEVEGEVLVQAVAELVDAAGLHVRVLEELLPASFGFADYAIERRSGVVLFSIDDEEVARLADLTDGALWLSLVNDGQAPLRVDWVDLHLHDTEPGACSEPPPSVRAWWAGDGDSREAISGLIGQGELGFARGLLGQALAFDGASQSVRGTDTEGIVPQALTLAAWVKPPQELDGARRLITKQPSYSLELDARHRPVLRLWNGAQHSVLDGTTSLESDTWHYIVATRGGSQVALFVDGAQQAVASLAGDIAYSTEPGSAIELGQPLSSASAATPLLLDEVIVYDRALGADEIQRLYRAGSAGYCLP